MIMDWDGKSPVAAARQIVEDCTNGRGETDLDLVRRSIAEIILELYNLQGRTVKSRNVVTGEVT